MEDYTSIASVYEHENQSDKALEIYNKALNIVKSQKPEPDPAKIAALTQNIGQVYETKHGLDTAKARYYLDTAMTHYKKVLEIDSALHEEDEAELYCNIADISLDKGDAVAALKTYSKALDIQKLMLSKHGISNGQEFARIYNSIGDTYNHLGNYPMAEIFSKLAFDTAVKDSLLEQQLISSKILSTIYEHELKFEKSLVYYKIINEISDSISNQKLSIRASLLTFENTEKEEAQKEEARRKAETDKLKQEEMEREKRNREYLHYSIAGLVAALFGFFVLFEITRKTTSKKGIWWRSLLLTISSTAFLLLSTETLMLLFHAGLDKIGWGDPLLLVLILTGLAYPFDLLKGKFDRFIEKYKKIPLRWQNTRIGKKVTSLTVIVGNRYGKISFKISKFIHTKLKGKKTRKRSKEISKETEENMTDSDTSE